MKSIRFVLALLLPMIALSSTSRAATLHYYRSGDLQIVPGGGSDLLFGLDGSHFVLDALFTIGPYTDYFGLPILVADSATLTITGSSDPLNNVTFNLNGNGQSVFFVPYDSRDAFKKAYLGYTPGGVPLTMFRPDGSLLNMHPSFEAEATTSGRAATPGVTAQTSDFFPGTIISQEWSDFAGTRYKVLNETISQTDPTPVPEPSSLLLSATALGIAAVVIRIKCRVIG